MSIQRFVELASLYGVRPDHLLAEALKDIEPSGNARIVIDLTQLSSVGAPTRELLTETLEKIRMQRGDFLSEVITLRSGDLESVALTADLDIDEVEDHIQPALRAERPR